MKLSSVIILFCIITFPVYSFSGTITKNNISYKGGVYTSHTSATLNAPYDKIYAILTDYNNLTKLSSQITDSRILQSSNNIIKVRTVTEDCLLFFCVEMINTQHMKDDGQGNIVGITIPEASDFKHGNMHWKIKKVNDNLTEISMDGEFAPSFFIPPLIGPMVIKMKVKEQTEVSIQKIEEIANY